MINNIIYLRNLRNPDFSLDNLKAMHFENIKYE